MDRHPSEESFPLLKADSIKGYIFNGQRLLNGVVNHCKMVIVKVNRVDKDIDKRLALADIVIRHFADEVEECTDLRVRQIDALVFFNDGSCFFQLSLFYLPLLNAFYYLINYLPPV